MADAGKSLWVLIMKIDFEITDEVYGVFRDAIVLPDDHGLSDAEIEAMKQARFDAWYAVVANPAPAEEDLPQEE